MSSCSVYILTLLYSPYFLMRVGQCIIAFNRAEYNLVVLLHLLSIHNASKYTILVEHHNCSEVLLILHEAQNTLRKSIYKAIIVFGIGVIVKLSCSDTDSL